MDQDSVHMVAASKVPMLKPGEYKLWRMRMEQYIQMIDYSLWEVIENGNAPPIKKVVEGVETTIAPSTAEEKAQRRLELKARSTLLMGIPDEHQLKFNSIKDAKSLLNKPEIDTLSLDDLYNNMKIYELEVKGTSSSSTNIKNVAFVCLNSTSSTDGAANTTHGATTASTQATELHKFHPDDLEEMDLRWQIAMLTIRARRFLKNTGRKRLQELRKQKIGEHKKGCASRDTTSNALVSCDGSGYDWSDQAEEGPTNFALMAYSSTSTNSEVSTDSNCSSYCLENVKILKEQNEQLLKDLRKSKLNDIAYKTGLEYVEARLLVYKKNESVYKEDIKLTVENFENSSKNLSKLIDSQIVDKYKTGLGYNAVPPPYTGNFMPPKLDLPFSSLEEFTSEPIVIKPIVEKSKAKASEAKPKVLEDIMGLQLLRIRVSD
ncbi:hypothetical protein Tco_0751108 [Tanacetum coccineum]|uniref:Uncharacterized protein n=1 Tax=Tanacetum coccineum TaxID=301880 RepID=A0ABQ4Z6C0_9ASTR